MDYGSTIVQLEAEQSALRERLALVENTILALQALADANGRKPTVDAELKAAATAWGIEPKKKVYEWKPSEKLRKGVLDVLRAWESATITDITSHSKMSGGSVKKVLEVLMGEGLVQRLPQRNAHNAYEYALIATENRPA